MVQSGWVSIKQRGIEMGQVIRQCLELGHTELELHQNMTMRPTIYQAHRGITFWLRKG